MPLHVVNFLARGGIRFSASATGPERHDAIAVRRALSPGSSRPKLSPAPPLEKRRSSDSSCAIVAFLAGGNVARLGQLCPEVERRGFAGSTGTGGNPSA